MLHFFSVYKTLEGKVTATNTVHDVDEAVRIIEKDMETYRLKRMAGEFTEARRINP